MDSMVYFMLFLTSWSGGAAEPQVERVPQLFTSKESCEVEGRRLIEKKKLIKQEVDDKRMHAFKCFYLPEITEYDPTTKTG